MFKQDILNEFQDVFFYYYYSYCFATINERKKNFNFKARNPSKMQFYPPIFLKQMTS